MTPSGRREELELWKELQEKRKENAQQKNMKWVIQGNKVVQIKITEKDSQN